MSCCSICLNSIRKTRSTTELPCGHLYHKKCINDWESRGNDTCPLCRKNMSKNEYKVTITIENLRKNNNSVINLNFQNVMNLLERMGITENELDMVSTDVIFDAEDLNDLRSILEDVGVGITDIDSSVLNTE